MIRVLATDLDGTLFYPKAHFTGMVPSNRRFLRRFVKEGNEVVIISGRGIRILPKLEMTVRTPLTFLGCNGAFLYEDGRFYLPQPIDNGEACDLFAACKDSYSILAWALFDDTENMYLYTRPCSWLVKNGVRLYNALSGFRRERMIFDDALFLRMLDHGHIYKLMLTFGLGEVSNRLAFETNLALKTRFGDRFTFVVSQNAVEISARNVSKGNGLMRFCKDRGIDPNTVAVCGDSGNDISMFDQFAHSFAMAQAPAFVQEHANHIIRRVSDVEEYLRHPELLAKDRLSGSRKE